MGKKNQKQKGGLGKTLIKDRFGSHVAHTKSDSYLHTSELGDGLDWNRINLKSVTEENTLDEFLATAELAGTEFAAEKLNVTIITPETHSGLLSAEEESKVKATQEENKCFLRIPRRPFWDETTSADELDLKERESFLEWRRSLNQLQDIEGLLLTPFERNLDFWRQLWRVIERSDVIVQIVDARNPLLYRSEDLESYVKEVSPNKKNVVLINKADFLTDEQRIHWAEYFDSVDIKTVFWSATMEAERFQAMEKAAAEEQEAMSDDEDGDEEEDEGWVTDEEEEVVESDDCDNSEKSPKDGETTDSHNAEVAESGEPVEASASTTNDPSKNDPKILNGDELVDFFKSCQTEHTYTENVTTIGLVGYPNVGKSSTINSILQTKKVPVSATPGRTKHFQTLFVDKTLMLCDCPGLVMPSFVSTKAAMVVNGILPIDQMRDYIPPVSLVCKLIPRKLLQALYGIILPKPDEGDDPNRDPTAYELLGCYAMMRGYMTHKGVPDFQRAARLILKDFVNGKLLFRQPPPALSLEEFKSTPEVTIMSGDKLPATEAVQARKQRVLPPKSDLNEVDRNFFSTKVVGSGSKGTQAGGSQSSQQSRDKSWKKHNNKNKKEKLRRLNSHFDA